MLRPGVGYIREPKSWSLWQQFFKRKNTIIKINKKISKRENFKGKDFPWLVLFFSQRCLSL